MAWKESFLSPCSTMFARYVYGLFFFFFWRCCGMEFQHPLGVLSQGWSNRADSALNKDGKNHTGQQYISLDMYTPFLSVVGI